MPEAVKMMETFERNMSEKMVAWVDGVLTLAPGLMSRTGDEDEDEDEVLNWNDLGFGKKHSAESR